MRLYTKYKSLRSKKKKPDNNGLYWVLILLAGAFLYWIWTANQNNTPEGDNSKARPTNTNSVRIRPTTNSIVVKQPAPQTNEVGDQISMVLTSKVPSSAIVTSVPLPRVNIATSNLEPSVITTSEPPSAPVTPPPPGNRSPRNLYEAQIALAREGISPGSLDGAMGSQTRAALRAFQARERLPITGELDVATRARLLVPVIPEKIWVVSSNDLARLVRVGSTWLAKSVQSKLDYESILELVSESSWSHPSLVRQLNPSISWTNIMPGTMIKIPDVRPPMAKGKASVIRIRLSERIMQVFDSGNQLIAHFPCSIAQKVEKRPTGQLFVEKIALNPNYRFDPEIFSESAEARKLRRPLMIPPGPNNPVGTAWIGLNRPGYGIHGTPRPEDVGRTESHGCFRLANWNAEYLAQLVRVGTTVFVEH